MGFHGLGAFAKDGLVPLATDRGEVLIAAGLLEDHGGLVEVPPFGVAEQMLQVPREPILDTAFRLLGVAFEGFREAVDEFRLHSIKRKLSATPPSGS
jgi:hypothetical protein